MARKISILHGILGFGLILSASACTPTMATRGNYLDDDRLKTLQVGVSTKAEVEQQLGTATTTDPFDPNTWYYIGEKTATEAFFDPEIQSRKIVVVYFDENGLLKNAQEIDEKAGKDIETVKKKTPAPGKEMNAFEQFLSNLGKFNNGGMMSQPAGPGQ